MASIDGFIVILCTIGLISKIFILCSRYGTMHPAHYDAIVHNRKTNMKVIDGMLAFRLISG